MKKFKLIKQYPGSPKLGTLTVDPDHALAYSYFAFDRTQRKNISYNIDKDIIENNPEFWESQVFEVMELQSEEGLIGFRHKNDLFGFPEDTLYKEIGEYAEEELLQDVKPYKLIEIRRVSDGVKFRIGDKVIIGNTKITITRLTIDPADNEIAETVTKYVPEKFITTDGVVKEEGDTVYKMVLPGSIQHIVLEYNKLQWRNLYESDLVYSTAKLAEKELENTRVNYSINDVKKAWAKSNPNASHMKLLLLIDKLQNPK